MDNRSSAVGSLHVFSEKSKSSSSVTSYSFYFLHVTLLNFIEKMRSIQVVAAVW